MRAVTRLVPRESDGEPEFADLRRQQQIQQRAQRNRLNIHAQLHKDGFFAAASSTVTFPRASVNFVYASASSRFNRSITSS